jgi:hypothetical protein
MPFSYTMKSEDRYAVVTERLVRFAIRLHQLDVQAPIKVGFSNEQSAHIAALSSELPDSVEVVEQHYLEIYHNLLCSLLFSIHPNVDKNARQDPITIFFICMNLEHTGNFKSAGTIVDLCSTMLHDMRLIAVQQISDESDKDNEPDAVLR